ncbi:MAG: hypothetical protein EA365_10360 [Gloeocapsa sp. DLM2.Bin57]|nr:MAG: hypothetical protein EA365_10360 [Gloeocapsa sp. DLM2.Bin57]
MKIIEHTSEKLVLKEYGNVSITYFLMFINAFIVPFPFFFIIFPVASFIRSWTSGVVTTILLSFLTILYLIFIVYANLWCINKYFQTVIHFDKNKNILQIFIINEFKKTQRIEKEFFLEQIQEVLIEPEKDSAGDETYYLYLILPDGTRTEIDSSSDEEQVEKIAKTLTDFLRIELRKNGLVEKKKTFREGKKTFIEITEHTSRKLVFREKSFSFPPVVFLVIHTIVSILVLLLIIMLWRSGTETITCQKLNPERVDCTVEYSRLMGLISTQPRLITEVQNARVARTNLSSGENFYHVIYLSGSQGDYPLESYHFLTNANKLNHELNDFIHNSFRQEKLLLIGNDNFATSVLKLLIVFLLIFSCIDFLFIKHWLFKKFFILDKNKKMFQVAIINSLTQKQKVCQEFFLVQLAVVMEREEYSDGNKSYTSFLVLPDGTKKEINYSTSELEVEKMAKTLTHFLGIELRKNY